jgi:hypothetical protein
MPLARASFCDAGENDAQNPAHTLHNYVSAVLLARELNHLGALAHRVACSPRTSCVPVPRLVSRQSLWARIVRRSWTNRSPQCLSFTCALTGMRCGATHQPSRAASEFTAAVGFGSSTSRRNSKRRNARNAKSEGPKQRHALFMSGTTARSPIMRPAGTISSRCAAPLALTPTVATSVVGGVAQVGQSVRSNRPLRVRASRKCAEERNFLAFLS